MILQYHHLSGFPSVFQSMTGVRVSKFDALYQDMQGYYVEAEWHRLDWANPERESGRDIHPC